MIDKEHLALAILNDDRRAGGWPPLDTRDGVPNSDGYLRNVDAVLADIAAQGWVLAPRVATEEMLKAGTEHALADQVSSEHGGWHGYISRLWSAMIEAVHPTHDIAREE